MRRGTPNAVNPTRPRPRNRSGTLMRGSILRNRSRSIRKGFALPTVLLLLAVMSVVAVRLVDQSRTDLAVARAHLSEAVLRHAADAGFELFVARYPEQEDFLSPPPVTLTVGAARVRVEAVNEAGKVDLNGAAGALIAGVFRAAELEDDRAEELANQYLDFQQQGGRTVLHSVDELLQLPGVDHAVLERVRPYVTVYTGGYGVDARVAPRAVLLAVPNVTEDIADRIIATREAGEPLPAEARASRRWLRSRSVSTFTLRSTATLADGTSFVREAVVNLDDPRRPVVMSWRRAHGPNPAPGDGVR